MDLRRTCTSHCRCFHEFSVTGVVYPVICQPLDGTFLSEDLETVIPLPILTLFTRSQTFQVLGAAYQADLGANITNVSFADVFAAPGGPFRSLVRSVQWLTSVSSMMRPLHFISFTIYVCTKLLQLPLFLWPLTLQFRHSFGLGDEKLLRVGFPKFRDHNHGFVS